MPTDVAALTIRSLRLDWLVAIERGGDSAAARLLAGDVATALPTSLRQLSITVPGDDPDAIVFIDRLTLDIDVGAAWDRDTVTEVIARSLGHDLGRQLAATSAGDGVVRYRDRAELLAQFLIELVAGHAFETWRHAEFEGVRALSPSAAARTLCEGSPAIFLDALGRLGEGSLPRVTRTLSEGDARRILACYRGDDGGSSEAATAIDAAEAVWSAIEASPGFSLTVPGARESLEVLACAARLHPDVSAAALVGALDTIAEVVAAAINSDGQAPPPVAPAAPARWEALRARMRAASHAPVAQRRGALSIPTAHGGALMLLGLLDKPFRRVALEIGLKKRITPRGMRRTFQDLCRAAEVGDVVTRSISGHATEEMQRHYSTVTLEEQRKGLSK